MSAALSTERDRQSLPRCKLKWIIDGFLWGCGLWLTPMLGSRLYSWIVELYYKKSARSYDSRAVFAGYLEPLHNGVEALAKALGPRAILDVATGTGSAAIWIAEEIPESQVVGLDVSRTMIELACAKADARALRNVRFVRGNMVRLPFRDASFDFAVVQNAFVALDDIDRVVGPNGLILIAFSLGNMIPAPVLRLFVRSLKRRHVVVQSGNTGHGVWLAVRPARDSREI